VRLNAHVILLQISLAESDETATHRPSGLVSVNDTV